MSERQAQVAVIGGGITGLATAFFLQQRGVDVVVLEREARAGGLIRSERREGFLVEHGPNSTLETNPEITRLVREVGLEGEKLYAGSASKNRYIVRDGRLVPLPMSPLAFASTPLFSARGKLRLLAEPFAQPPPLREETLAEFVVRRVGREFLDYAVNPFIAGVYAGDPARLSVRSALPKLYALEERYGGLLKGAIKGRRERRRRGEASKTAARIFTFAGGMSRLPEAIAAKLGDRLILGAEVSRIEPGFRIHAGSMEIVARKVVVALPAARSAELLRPFSGVAAEKMAKIPSAPVAVVIFGFHRYRARRPLDGFGFLVPEVEKRKILGTIFTSAIFPGRGPAGADLLTTFIGGMRQPELVGLDDEELGAIVAEELTDLVGLRTKPDFAWIRRWESAIPQYHLGHSAIIAAVEALEREHPGLHLAGNWRGGISVADCAARSSELAVVMSHVRS